MRSSFIIQYETNSKIHHDKYRIIRWFFNPATSTGNVKDPEIYEVSRSGAGVDLCVDQRNTSFPDRDFFGGKYRPTSSKHFPLRPGIFRIFFSSPGFFGSAVSDTRCSILKILLVEVPRIKLADESQERLVRSGKKVYRRSYFDLGAVMALVLLIKYIFQISERVSFLQMREHCALLPFEDVDSKISPVSNDIW